MQVARSNEQKKKLQQFNIRERYYVNGQWLHPRGMIYGKSNTGKSKTIVSMLHEIMDMFGTAFLFCPTADQQSTYGKIFRKSFTYTTLDDSKLQRIRSLQNYLKLASPPGLQERDKNCLILIDDFASEREVAHSKELKSMVTKCRHENITLFFANQHLTLIPPLLRQCCEFLLIKQESTAPTLQMLFAEQFGVFETLENFQRAMLQHCKNYGSLVWVNENAETALEKRVFKYNSIHLEADFEMKCPLQWIIDDVLSKPDDVLKQDLLDSQKKMEETQRAEMMQTMQSMTLGRISNELEIIEPIEEEEVQGKPKKKRTVKPKTVIVSSEIEPKRSRKPVPKSVYEFVE